MGRIDYSDVGELAALKARVKKLEAAAPIGFSSITRGQLRIGGSAILLVDSSGGLVIHGSINGDGTITWSGVFTLSGTTNLTGPTKLTGTSRFEGDTTQVGPFHIQGATDITGALTVNGLTSLLKTLTVGSGGKIVIGNMVLDPAVSGAGGVGGVSAPAVIFLDAPQVVANHGLQVNDTLAAQGGVIFANLPTTTVAANVNVDTTFGTVRRVTSASRFKQDVQKLDLPDALLDVPVKDWVDKHAADRLAEIADAPRPFTLLQQADHDGLSLKRVPGVIAEEVEAAGGESFVSYTADGEIEGVHYDRLALARTEILAARLEAALARIEELEKPRVS